MRKWLARLSFSLIIVAAVLAWEAWRTRRGDRGPGREWQGYALVAGAAICFGLGLRGVRERHRLLDEESAERRDDPEDGAGRT
jgi:hypothetical protein